MSPGGATEVPLTALPSPLRGSFLIYSYHGLRDAAAAPLHRSTRGYIPWPLRGRVSAHLTRSSIYTDRAPSASRATEHAPRIAHHASPIYFFLATSRIVAS